MPETEGGVSEEGLRSNVNVGIQYISSWLRGNGAAGIYGLMEDAATAEIARGQVWQWLHHGVSLDDGRAITPELVRELETSERRRSARRSATTSGSSRRAGPTSPASCSSAWPSAATSSWSS